MTTAKDYRNDIRPNWCPGCGHYGVQAAITDAVVAKNIPPEKLAVISGIGCSFLAVSVVISMHMVHIQLMVVRFHTLKALNLLTKT
jgi:pyruvate/2-oxoacid:ferredoxin oxidoreductase beta subunit